jgi:hypothetical protein
VAPVLLEIVGKKKKKKKKKPQALEQFTGRKSVPNDSLN